jgi:hypothetical protein
MDFSWEEAWGLALLQGGLLGPLSAVWDSNIHSWCLKTIRQRPPRPGPPHPGPRWAAVSQASAKTVGSLHSLVLGRGLC